MKIQDSSFNGLKVTVGTKSVTHPRTHALTDAPKAICPINFFKVGGIIRKYSLYFYSILYRQFKAAKVSKFCKVF